jgi:hypothetical protein
VSVARDALDPVKCVRRKVLQLKASPFRAGMNRKIYNFSVLIIFDD